MPLGITGMQGEFLRHGGDHVHDQAAIEADALGAFGHMCAMRLHDLPRLGSMMSMPISSRTVSEALWMALQLVGGEKFGAGPVIDEIEVGGGLRNGASDLRPCRQRGDGRPSPPASSCMMTACVPSALMSFSLVLMPHRARKAPLPPA